MRDKFLLSATDVAKLLNISRSTLYEFNNTGKVPSPVKLGGRTLWRRDELELWVKAGCPGREAWNVQIESDLTNKV